MVVSRYVESDTSLVSFLETLFIFVIEFETRVCIFFNIWAEIEYKWTRLRRPEETRTLEDDRVHGRRVIPRRMNAPACGRIADIPQSDDTVACGSCSDVARSTSTTGDGVVWLEEPRVEHREDRE